MSIHKKLNYYMEKENERLYDNIKKICIKQ